MPQRFLRPGLRNSVRWNGLSRAAQVAFIGILTLVDDYGQYEGRASVLCAEIFTVWNDLHPDDPQDSAAFRRIAQELAGKRMIEFYDGPEGKTYLQVTQWQERVRVGAKRKWGGEGFSLRIPADSCGFLPPSPPPPPVVPAPVHITPPPPPPCEDGRGVIETAPNGEIDHYAYRLGQIYGRDGYHHTWPFEDRRNLVLLVRRPKLNAEIELLVAFKPRYKFFPQTLTSLMAGWEKTLDAARNPDIEKKPKSADAKIRASLTSGLDRMIKEQENENRV